MTGGKSLSVSCLEESCPHLAGLQLTSSVSLLEVKLLSDLGEEKLARASNWLHTCRVIPCPGSRQTLTWRGPGDQEEEAGRSSSLPGEESQTCVEWWGLGAPSLSAGEWIICPWSSSSVISNHRPAASPCQAAPQLPHPPPDQRTALDPLHLLDGGHVVHHPHVALVCNNVLTSEQIFYWRRQNGLAGRLLLVLIINIYNANNMVRQAGRQSGKIKSDNISNLGSKPYIPLSTVWGSLLSIQLCKQVAARVLREENWRPGGEKLPLYLPVCL